MLVPWLTRFVTSMYDKAYRWEGEMEEISAFLAEDGAERGEAAIYAGMARFYARLAADHAGPGEEIDALKRFLAQPTKG